MIVTLEQFVEHARRFGVDQVFETAQEYRFDPQDLLLLAGALERVDQDRYEDEVRARVSHFIEPPWRLGRTLRKSLEATGAPGEAAERSRALDSGGFGPPPMEVFDATSGVPSWPVGGLRTPSGGTAPHPERNSLAAQWSSYHCGRCGAEFASPAGVYRHLRSCDPPTAEVDPGDDPFLTIGAAPRPDWHAWVYGGQRNPSHD